MNGFLLGGMVGLVPLVLGLIFKQAALGRVGFLFCVFLGYLTGLVGPVVASIGFAIAIVVSWHRSGPDVTPARPKNDL